MQKGNHNLLNYNDIIASFAKLLSALCVEGEFRYQPDYLTEIFESILEAEIGNDLNLRTKMISCIKTSKMLAKALESFSDQQIENACIEIINA